MSTSLIDPRSDLDETLRARFSLEQFRPGQRDVIENVLQGRDVLCVMPTGGGKSLCYQLPALLLPGLTLVVSPLIALMKDQVDSLTQRGIKATLLNSSLDPEEQRNRILEIEAGLYDLVYVAPERFRSGRFVEAMQKLRPSLLAVDEAHCISQWGHDFRPDYARIGEARKKLGSPPCIALTATATDLVRRDIALLLNLEDPANFVTGFDRPNLTYAVVEARRDVDKLDTIASVLNSNPGSAVIYASSRKKCEDVAGFVRGKLRRTSVVYHAGMSREDRAQAQDQFMGGDADVVVATNAFGMGVDKPDIRSVIHFSIPGTVEAYYQEAGRAGRDGSPSSCVLLYSPGDQMLQQRFIENEYPLPDVVFAIYNYLRNLNDDPIERTHEDIKAEAGVDLSTSGVGTALKLLETAGLLERFSPRENMAIVRFNVDDSNDLTDPKHFVSRLSPQANIQRVVLLGLEGLAYRRYNEPVYFQPDELVRSLGLDRPALNRALKSLTAEFPIDYIPPFRGNATRMIDRSRNGRDLGIDFAALDQRKQREFEKLDRMVQYARTHLCRRAYILGYFGDHDAERVHCGRCDNCGVGSGPSRARFPIESQTAVEIVLKVLSGVARAKGRFGKTLIAQMLRGSGSEKMERLGLSKLSTFGILKSFSDQELAALIDALTTAGLVEMVEIVAHRPVVNLTESGWDFVKGINQTGVALVLDDGLTFKLGGTVTPRVVPDGPARTASKVTDPEFDPLRRNLKAKRLEWSKAEGKPAYTIFSDATLEAILAARPKTPLELSTVKGVGPATMERHGKSILEVILYDGEPSEPAPEPPPTASRAFSEVNESLAVKPRPPAEEVSRTSTEDWTWQLLDRGFSAEEAAAIRSLDLVAIIRHALLIAKQGRTVPIERFLNRDQIQAWEAWNLENGDRIPSDNPSLSPELWRLFLACRK